MTDPTQPTRIPHACGGEPFVAGGMELSVSVFPTRVGVNRNGDHVSPLHPRIPHACGGEPKAGGRITTNGAYSPRVWG